MGVVILLQIDPLATSPEPADLKACVTKCFVVHGSRSEHKKLKAVEDPQHKIRFGK
jgi:hypothetical protein